MYYTGIHPLTKEKVYIPRDPHEKAIQRALMQYKNPANRSLVLEGLKMAGRMDLVGFGPKCLIRRRETGERNLEEPYQVQRERRPREESRPEKQSATRIRKNKSNCQNGYQ